mmetsp:Transcript_24343/g.52381  ORF Transcript_24343/g.52381 Transcript_24343/m.52381 type:complete len:381 (-) Transcript_24343:117-1259(-)
MVKSHRIHGTKVVQVVLVRGVVAVPGDDVVGRKGLGSAEERSVHLVDHLVALLNALALEPGHRSLEVLRVGQAVGPDGTQIRQREVPLEDLKNVTPRLLLQQVNTEPDAPLQHADLARGHLEPAELGANPQPSQLGHDEEIAVRVRKARAVHTLVRSVDMDCESGLAACASGATHGEHSLYKVHLGVLFVGHFEGQPPELVGRDDDVRAALVEAGDDLAVGKLHWMERLVRHRGPHPIKPAPLVVLSWHCEGAAADLLCVEVVGAPARVVAALGQGPGDGLGRHVVPESAAVLEVARRRLRAGPAVPRLKAALGRAVGQSPVEVLHHLMRGDARRPNLLVRHPPPRQTLSLPLPSPSLAPPKRHSLSLVLAFRTGRTKSG